MANYVINGITHENVAGATLLDDAGSEVLFRPASSVGVDGITEIKTGTFEPPYSTYAGDASNVNKIPVPHGLAGIPDGWYITPETWSGDIDEALAVTAWERKSSSWCGVGRRSVADATQHVNGSVEATSVLADETYIYPIAPAFGKFQAGVTYRWIAWRLEATV